MADELFIDTSDLESFATQLEGLPIEVQDKMIPQATYVGAQIFQAAIVAKAPTRAIPPSEHSTGLPEGWIKADIRIEKLRRGRGWIIGPTSVTAHVVRWVEYGHWLVREGYRSLKRGKLQGGGKRVREIRPYPFIRPAFDEFSQVAMVASNRKLGELIAEYWRRAAGKMGKAA